MNAGDEKPATGEEDPKNVGGGGAYEYEEILDETSSDPSIVAPGLTQPVATKYDADQFHDQARKKITYWLLALLSVLFVGAFVCLFIIEGNPKFEQLKALLEILLGPLVALVSAATGFYFGAKSGNKGAGG